MKRILIWHRKKLNEKGRKWKVIGMTIVVNLTYQESKGKVKWRCLKTIQVLRIGWETSRGRGGGITQFSIFLCCLYVQYNVLYNISSVLLYTFFVASWTFILGIKERFQDKNCHFAITIRSHLMILKPAAC